MSFKHDKPTNSSIFRSLQRIAVEKGLVTLDKIEKKASAIDLNVTDNLTENLIKLANGLRAKGLEVHASEIETALLKYKKASADIINQGHPKGSPKLSNMQGDCVVETIIDKHKANVKMLEKQPTGKYAQNNKILKDVKVALAQSAEVIADEVDTNSLEFDNARQKAATSAMFPIHNIMDILKRKILSMQSMKYSWISYKQVILKNISEVEDDLKVVPPTGDSLKDLITDLNDIKGDIFGEPDQLALIDQAIGYYELASDFLLGKKDFVIKNKLLKEKTDKEKNESLFVEKKLATQLNIINSFIAANKNIITSKLSAHEKYLADGIGDIQDSYDKSYVQKAINYIKTLIGDIWNLNKVLDENKSSVTFNINDISAFTAASVYLKECKTFDEVTNKINSLISSGAALVNKAVELVKEA